MRDELHDYYQNELEFLRQTGVEFAQRYPKVAGRLRLEEGKSQDPHVERLLEAFALLAARVHLKIDDEFPQVVEGLFSILYPHYIRPIPSMGIVQFHLDPEQGKMTTGLRTPRGSLLYTRPVNGAPCKFRTCFDNTLWPLRVHAAEWKSADRLRPAVPAMNSVAALRLELHCFQDVAFSNVNLETLRFFLAGGGDVPHSLIELLSNNCIRIIARDLSSPGKKMVELSPDHVRQAGLSPDESLIPYPHRSFWGYRILQEYFAFPEKFLFLDVSGFDRLRAADFGDKAELIFLISDFERAERRQAIEMRLSERTFALGCVPVVNLFEQTAEPILIDQKRYEYRIIPDAHREQAFDIFSVDRVSAIMGGSGEIIEYEPFYSHRHSRASLSGENEKAFYHVSRRPSAWRTDEGSDVYIGFVDLTGAKTAPDRDTVTVRLTCTNRDLPFRLPWGDVEGDFELEGGGPITRIVTIINPTNAVQPPARSSLLWRLVSQMSLNYLSLVGDGADAFREILRLHNFGESISAERQIDGILSLESRPHFTRLVSEHGVSFVRGTEVEIELDEEQFAGAGVYSFCAMLDVFLGLYTSVNSFSRLVARTRQRKGVIRRWPPRSGRKILM